MIYGKRKKERIKIAKKKLEYHKSMVKELEKYLLNANEKRKPI